MHRQLTFLFQCFPQCQTLIVAVSVQLGWHIEHAHSRLSLTESANFRFSAQLTWMGIRCNRAALLDSPHFIRCNCPNSDSKTSHLAEVVRLLLPFTDTSFTALAFWKKVPSASHDNVITGPGHNKNCLQGLALFVGA